MKKSLLYFLLLVFTVNTYSQNEHAKLVELGKAYKNFMFINDPTNEFIAGLKVNTPENLTAARDFIIQTIIPKTKIINKAYLALPDEQTLKNIYIIRAVNYNLHAKEPVANERIVDSLMDVTVSRNELIDSYYSMLFASYGNKVKPFNMSKINFNLSEYNLQNDTEKGIFFLRCMEYCGKNIWGLINIAKPMNTKGAYDYIKKFPKFNGLKYYQYNDFNFPDFEMIIYTNRGKESYKDFFINKYYEVLLNHLICLKKENRPEKEYHEVLLGSILKDKDYYKHSKNKSILDGLFSEVSRDR
ncbi:hypothetical protein M2451_001445 [Dysgonomonas sp. PFB1-18]|uniref:hypothetical protein n=1 Tax=unclassified Dysgonomonas TaxID=2630389 RepID=UPI0024731FE6|nr:MULTISPECIES: hypothetical protein [unclassified Dysgonomonas]MDH6308879.1 hypothetical protein [Dysgonomonas sp. PF1-14]MDH6338425.1 hypothetical protein [Dysgonomonas sp. PF1-16]MDH6380128.1 hypothetical protein [Dysgonomonas sp. PFB1-18]MDH6397253.1 hypothetical protein [Dysgonomonas sp. PF1-23]